MSKYDKYTDLDSSPVRPLTPYRDNTAELEAMIRQHRRKGTSGPGGWLATFLVLVVGPSFLIWLWFQIANLPAVNHFGKIFARCVEAGFCVP